MGLVNMKCPSCGASIQLDGRRESGFCSYCGAKVHIREVIDKIRMDRAADIERYLHAGQAAIKEGKGNEAYACAGQVLDLDPDNAKAWELKMEGIICTPGCHCLEVLAAGNKAVEADASSEMKSRIYRSFLSACCSYLHDACRFLLQDLQSLKALYQSHCALDPDHATSNMLNYDSINALLVNGIRLIPALRFAVPDEEIGKDEKMAELAVGIIKEWVACREAWSQRVTVYGASLLDESQEYWDEILEKMKQGVPARYLTCARNDGKESRPDKASDTHRLVRSVFGKFK